MSTETTDIPVPKRKFVDRVRAPIVYTKEEVESVIKQYNNWSDPDVLKKAVQHNFPEGELTDESLEKLPLTGKHCYTVKDKDVN
jgi:hypothetical protein